MIPRVESAYARDWCIGDTVSLPTALGRTYWLILGEPYEATFGIARPVLAMSVDAGEIHAIHTLDTYFGDNAWEGERYCPHAEIPF